MNNTVYGNTIEKLKNGINVRSINNEKSCLKWNSKSSSGPQKIFDNDVVAIRKSKVTLTLHKPAYLRKCILHLSKVLMYNFHNDYIKN